MRQSWVNLFWVGAATMALTACFESGPIFVPVAGSDAGPQAMSDVGPDRGPPIVECGNNEDCVGLDPTGNATYACDQNEGCRVVACTLNLVDANDDPRDGCECIKSDEEEPARCDGEDSDCDGRVDESTDFSADVLNCGACGQECGAPPGGEPPNIVEYVCRDSRCGIGACSQGAFNPTGRIEDGCPCFAGVTSRPAGVPLPDDDIGGGDIDYEAPPTDARIVYPGNGQPGLMVWSRGQGNNHTLRAARVDPDNGFVGGAHSLIEYQAPESRIAGVFALEDDGAFAVHLAFGESRGGIEVHGVNVDFGAGSEAPRVTDTRFNFPPTVSWDDYRVAPSGRGLCAAYVMEAEDGSQRREVREVTQGRDLGGLDPEDGVPQSLQLLGMACPSNSCDCAAAWLRVSERHLYVRQRVISESAHLNTGVAMAWGDAGLYVVWQVSPGGSGDERAALVDPSTGNIIGIARQVPRGGAGDPPPHQGMLVADDDGDGEAEQGDGFILSWTAGAAAKVHVIDDPGAALGEPADWPATVSGRVDASRYYAEAPPRIFDADRVLTSGPPWPAPNGPEASIAAVDGRPLLERETLEGRWLVWQGTGGIYASRFDSVGMAGAPIVVMRTTGVDALAATSGPGGALIVFSAYRDRLTAAVIEAVGTRSSFERPIAWPGGSGRVETLRVLPWQNDEVLLVLNASAGEGQRTNTVAVGTPMEDAPLAISAASPTTGRWPRVASPDPSIGALMISWLAGNDRDRLLLHQIDGQGAVVEHEPLATVREGEAAELIYSDVSGRIFALWLASESPDCGQSTLNMAVFDRDLSLPPVKRELYKPEGEDDSGECLDRLLVTANAGGGVTAVVGRYSGNSSYVVTVDEGGRLMGEPLKLEVNGFSHRWPMELAATRDGLIGHVLTDRGEAPQPGLLSVVDYCE